MKEEILLIATLLQDASTYGPIKRFCAKEVLTSECSTLLSIIDKYSKELNINKNIPTDNLIEWAKVTGNLPVGTSFDRLKANDLLTKASMYSITNQDEIKNTLKHFLNLKYALDIHNLSQSFVMGKATFEDFQKVVDEFLIKSSDIEEVEAEFVTTDLAQLSADTVGSNGLDWRLDCLNLSLGPLRPGDLLIIGARPEVGKTTFVASEVSFMAPQLEDDRPVLWICNEETGNRIQFRAYQAVLGWDKTKMLMDITKTEAELVKVLGNKDKIRVLFDPYITVEKIEKVCEAVNPGLIVIDQLDKVMGMKADRPDLILKALYQWARVLSNKYGPVLAVSQCDSSAEGQRWLHQGQLDGSKTAKPGEADAIILIGKDADDKYEFDRFISLPKNKLAGGPKSDERARHGKFEVRIKPDIARYED